MTAKTKKKQPVSFALMLPSGNFSKSMLQAEAEQMTKGLEPEQSLRMYVAAKAAEVMLKHLIETLKANANHQADMETSGGKTIATMNGVEITMKASAGSWDYGNDPELICLQAEADVIQKKIKERQKFRQNIPEGEEFADPKIGLLLKRALHYGGAKSLVVTIPEHLDRGGNQ